MASHSPAAMMWKTQGSLCSPTALRLQHMSVPYSRVRVGVKVSTDLEPLLWMKRCSTCFASAELLKVHLGGSAVTGKEGRKKNEIWMRMRK